MSNMENQEHEHSKRRLILRAFFNDEQIQLFYHKQLMILRSYKPTLKPHGEIDFNPIDEVNYADLLKLDEFIEIRTQEIIAFYE